MKIVLTEREAKDYSVGRAILASAGGERGFEGEVSDELGKAMGRPPRSSGGIFVPTRLMRPTAFGLDTKTGASGNWLVPTVVELEEALRQTSRCIQLGSPLLTGLRANVEHACENATTAASWISYDNPGVDISDTDPSFTLKSATPHLLQCSTSYSKQLLVQNSVQIENFLRRSLAKSHAIALDSAAVNGSGLQGQPVGLLKQPNLGTVAIGSDGGPATYAKICELEELVALGNADFPTLAFWTNPTQRKKLRQVFKNGVGSEPAWSDEGPGPLGYQGVTSTAIPKDLSKGNGTNLSAIVAGNFQYLVFSGWGALEIISDPFKGKKQGMIEITSFGAYDCTVLQLGAFAAIIDAS